MSLHTVNKNSMGAGNTDQLMSIDYLFKSDFYEIKDWSFYRDEHKTTHSGYNDCFCLAFIRKGFFAFDLSQQRYELHTGHFVIDKANYEYRLRPTPGQWTIFNFTNDFYLQFVADYGLQHHFFFANENIISLLLRSTPEIDYLHHQILVQAPYARKLEMDTLVLDFLKCATETVTLTTLDDKIVPVMKKNHLSTIERAKEFLQTHFLEDVSLFQLADYCHVSPFHFSRLFKTFTSYSPYQYLLNIRLKNAELMLKNSALPITDIGFSSGFNSVEHFATAFKQRYQMNPTQYRKEVG